MWSNKEICTFVDLTSLNAFDSKKSIDEFLHDALNYQQQGFSVAAVCLFPNFSAQAVEKLKHSSIKTAVVAGNFPNSQGFLATRLKECEYVLENGVDEVDIVLNLGAFEDQDYQLVVSEIKAFKGLMPNKTLKVILETGYLKSKKRIQKASELAIEGGADFIKTSTGKGFEGATLEAVDAMAETIASHKSTREVGLKISGGVRSSSDAVRFFEVIEKHLGQSYLTPDRIRIGASSLVSNLINE